MKLRLSALKGMTEWLQTTTDNNFTLEQPDQSSTQLQFEWIFLCKVAAR